MDQAGQAKPLASLGVATLIDRFAGGRVSVLIAVDKLKPGSVLSIGRAHQASGVTRLTGVLNDLAGTNADGSKVSRAFL